LLHQEQSGDFKQLLQSLLLEHLPPNNGLFILEPELSAYEPLSHPAGFDTLELLRHNILALKSDIHFLVPVHHIHPKALEHALQF
jgi:hypothetical protein